MVFLTSLVIYVYQGHYLPRDVTHSTSPSPGDVTTQHVTIKYLVEDHETMWTRPVAELDLLLYKAYYDVERKVRVLLTGPRRTVLDQRKTFQCRYEQTDGRSGSWRAAKITEIKSVSGAKGLRLWGSFLLDCPVATHDIEHILNVTVRQDRRQDGRQETAVNRTISSLYVHRDDTTRSTDDMFPFVLCLPVMFNFTAASELVEYIELHRVMGVQRVVVYDEEGSQYEGSRTTDIVREILRLYSRVGVVHRIPWNLRALMNRAKKDHIHKMGQVLAMNDCMLRYRWKARYLAMYDLDEVLIPVYPNVSDWHQLIKTTLRKARVSPESKVASLTFQSQFFSKINLPEKLVYMSEKVHRWSPIMPPSYRMKTVVNPRQATLMVTHVLEKRLPASLPVKVPPDVAIVRHYRTWAASGTVRAMIEVMAKFCCKKSKVTNDTDSFLYELVGQRLRQGVRAACLGPLVTVASELTACHIGDTTGDT